MENRELAKFPTLIEQVYLKPKQTPGLARRAVPYQIARSSLFTAQPANLKNRKGFSSDGTLEAYSKFTIAQTSGRQLVQDEGTVWLELLHLALKTTDDGSDQPILVEFAKSGLLKALDWKIDSNNRRRLDSILERLVDATVSIVQNDQSSWSASLLIAAGKSRQSARSKSIFFIDRKIVRSFLGGYTLLNREQRHNLRHKPLAQWMHAFYSTHKSPTPLKGSLIKRLSGCQTQKADVWIKKLTEALKALAIVTGWNCSYNYNYDIVHINRGLEDLDATKKAKPAATPYVRAPIDHNI